MTAPEIRSGDLEETLVYEDLFLEYFNVFLALPAFPVRLYYDRLTGNLQELDGAPQEKALEYGANDTQHERTLLWLRQERLALFRKSPLYLEYKLVKLLLRPLEDHQPVSRYGIRGYSRQTTSAGLSSGQSSAAPQLLSAPGIPSDRTLESLQPFPTRMHSSPAAPGYESEPYSLSLLEQYGDAIMRLYHPPDRPIAESEFYTSFQHDRTGEMGMQKSPPPKNQGEPYSSRARAEHGWAGSDLDIDWMDPEDIYTEEEENFLRQNNLPPSSLQQLKETALSSRDGMASFVDFLQGTLGFHLLHFWMDCEQFKEESVDLVSQSPEEARHRCVHLFRSIQNKYRNYLSPAWQEQIRLSQQDWGPSYQALRRSQYDALRRLRAYWMPRFLIHQQRRLRHKAGRREKLEAITMEIPVITPSMGDLVPFSRWKNRQKGMTSMPGQQGALSSQKIPNESLLDRMIPALNNDNASGGPFIHYLKRFEPPQYTQIFLLWQELSEYGDSESDQRERCGESGCGVEVYPRTAGQRDTAGCGFGGRLDATLGPSHVTPEQMQSSDFCSMYRLVMTALCDPWLRFLSYDIATFLKSCSPVSFKHREMESLENESPKAGQKRAGKESQKWAGNSEDTKKVRRRKNPLREAKAFPEYPGQLPLEPDNMLEMLQNRTVYKMYRKVVHETEETQTLKALEILYALQSDKSNQKVLGLVQRVLGLDIIHLPHLQAIKKHLTHDLSKGKISSLSVKEVTLLLSSLLAPSFHIFRSEMLGRLKDYGMEQPGDEGWARLEPILQVLTSKMVLKRLRGRKNNLGHQAQMQPTTEDISAFNRALQLAAEGWPTPEVLHFLRYLQTHGPEEGMPLLENNLLCCLEVQKYRNAHHAMPDRGLLRRKVQVVKERFLLPQGNSVLQVPPEILETVLKNTEAAVHAEMPTITIFDQLCDSLSDSLLPFWAGFRKTWLIRSSDSAKKVPMLRVQQMLRKRLALFEVEEIPLRTFHLPPVQNPPEKSPPSVLTFSFSITHGITVKGRGEESGESQTPTPPASRRMSRNAVLPPINRTSPDQKQMNPSETMAIPEPISSQ